MSSNSANASSPPPPNPAQASLPKLTPEFVENNYPSSIKILHVDVLNRHGERTPTVHRMPALSPKYWNFCAEGNRLHADFLRAIDFYTQDSAKGDGNKTRNLPQQPWQNYVFKTDVRNTNIPINANEAKFQHKTDKSQPTAATCRFGQLTDVGRASMTKLGAHLRELYVNRLGFMPSVLDQSGSGGPAEELYLRSTSYTRSFESLQQLLFGLYPNQPKTSSPLFSINVRPSNRENMYPDFDCKGMARLFKEFNAKSLELFAGEYQQLYRDLLKVPALKEFFDAEYNPGTTRVGISTWDTVGPMRAHGIPLPKEIDDELMARISMMAAAECMHSLLKSTALTRMQIGPLLHELVGNLVSAVEADRTKTMGSQPRMGIYSGHDTTVGPLLAAFGDGLTGPAAQAPVGILWPPFAASMRIELIKDTTSPYPVVRPSWEDDQADHSEDLTQIAHEKRVRPINVPSALYHWPPRRSGSAGDVPFNPRATRGYYVRVWYNDRTVQLPACRDAGAHHSKLGPAVCTLDGFFKQVAKYVPSEKEARKECNLVGEQPQAQDAAVDAAKAAAATVMGA
ncbi:phosphoglycerate mutase-like protein [Martensiomyces pterosporus]|nr:phosphoglycerate mutase-like protein [Martensiomyces pterosporus]